MTLARLFPCDIFLQVFRQRTTVQQVGPNVGEARGAARGSPTLCWCRFVPHPDICGRGQKMTFFVHAML